MKNTWIKDIINNYYNRNQNKTILVVKMMKNSAMAWIQKKQTLNNYKKSLTNIIMTINNYKTNNIIPINPLKNTIINNHYRLDKNQPYNLTWVILQ